jgi:PAS domain S-box-containing protein
MVDDGPGGGDGGDTGGGSAILDDERRIVAVSPGLARLLGREPDDMVGHVTSEWVVGDPDEVVPDEEQPGTGPWAEVKRGRLFLRREDGSHLWARVTRARLGDGQGGVVIVDDVSGQVEAEAVLARHSERTAFLSELSVALSEAGPDVRAVLDCLTRSLGEHYEALSVARLAGADGVFRVAASHGPDGERTIRLVEQAGDISDLEPWVGDVLRSGRALVANGVDLAHAIASDQVASLVAELGLSSVLVLPLMGSDGPVGLVTVVRFDPGADGGFTDDDATFAEQVARLASLSLDNARLVATLQARTAAAEETTEELRRAVRLLGSSIAQRRALVRRLARAHEEERSRIAVEIHDDSIQVLTGLGLQLQLLRRTVDSPAATGILDEVERTVAEATDRLRHVLFDLRPPALELEGLTLSVEELAGRVLGTTGCEVSVRSTLARPASPVQQAVAYRIVKEALANAARHACATRVEVVFEDRSGGLLLRVSDDGVGFDPSVAGDDRHFGLPLMREQAELAEGWLVVSSQPGEGTTLEAWVPGDGDDGGRWSPWPATG